MCVALSACYANASRGGVACTTTRPALKVLLQARYNLAYSRGSVISGRAAAAAAPVCSEPSGSATPSAPSESARSGSTKCATPTALAASLAVSSSSSVYASLMSIGCTNSSAASPVSARTSPSSSSSPANTPSSSCSANACGCPPRSRVLFSAESPSFEFAPTTCADSARYGVGWALDSCCTGAFAWRCDFCVKIKYHRSHSAVQHQKCTEEIVFFTQHSVHQQHFNQAIPRALSK